MKLVALRSGKLLWHLCSHTQVSLVARKPLSYHLHMYSIEKKHALSHKSHKCHSSQDSNRKGEGMALLSFEKNRLDSKSVFLAIWFLGSVHVRAQES